MLYVYKLCLRTFAHIVMLTIIFLAKTCIFLDIYFISLRTCHTDPSGVALTSGAIVGESLYFLNTLSIYWVV